MNAQWWSWLLTIVGVSGLYLAGRRSWTGWAVGLAAQGLWFAYAIATTQWGFLASCFAYGFINARNLRVWYRTPPVQPASSSPVITDLHSTSVPRADQGCPLGGPDCNVCRRTDSSDDRDW